MSKFGRTGYFQQNNNHSSTMNVQVKNDNEKSKFTVEKFERMSAALFGEMDKEK